MQTHTFHTRSRDEDNVSHDGGECVVVRELGDDERDREVGPMFTVRFPDGFQVDAFADELTPEPTSMHFRYDAAGSQTETDDWTERPHWVVMVRDAGGEEECVGHWPLCRYADEQARRIRVNRTYDFVRVTRTTE